MKKPALLLTIAAAVSTLCIFCGGGDSTPTQYTGEDIDGTWEEVIPAEYMAAFDSTAVPEDVTISLSIQIVDSTYELLVAKPSDTLLIQSGSWIVESDTLVLAGEFGMMIDTSAAPDTLKPIPPSLLSIPVEIPMTLSSSVKWPISLSDLDPVIDAFPIDESMKGVLKNIELIMDKTE